MKKQIDPVKPNRVREVNLLVVAAKDLLRARSLKVQNNLARRHAQTLVRKVDPLLVGAKHLAELVEVPSKICHPEICYYFFRFAFYLLDLSPQ